MPELPEVETIKNGIQSMLGNALVLDVKVNNPRLRQPVPDDLSEIIVGHKILYYKRVAKYIIIGFDNSFDLIIHLGMSGRILLSKEEYTPQKHDHIVFTTNKGYMVYNDPRRFGLCTYIPSAKLMEHPLFNKIGVDPFDPEFNGVTLKEKLIKKTIPIKLALLDQSIVCGIGNIYASEALFLAKILPTRPSNSLSDEEYNKLVKGIRKTLSMAIEAGGSTLRDYKQPDGNLGYFQNHHCVYNKTGQRCPNCQCDVKKTGGIKKIIMNNRSTFFCETKQR